MSFKLESAEIIELAGVFTVTPVWSGVDRQRSYSMSCGKNAKYAIRLKKAFEAGACYKNAQVMTDVNGATYVNINMLVAGRHLNSDLMKLGF